MLNGAFTTTLTEVVVWKQFSAQKGIMAILKRGMMKMMVTTVSVDLLSFQEVNKHKLQARQPMQGLPS